MLQSLGLPWFKLLHDLDVTWPEERLPRRSSMAPLTVVCPDKTRLSGLPCFEQELLAPIHFVYEHILVTPLGN
jgi:hypothetical protein